MKKQLIYATMASVLLLCSACGKQEDVQEDSIVNNESTQENIDTPPSDNNADTEQTLSVSIELQTQRNDTAEDGTTIYTSAIVYPVVSIEGNEAAAEKINADIQTRIEAFRSDTMTLDMAKEGYQYSLTEDSEYDFLGYSSDLDFVITRADSNVISFTATYYSFSGGAHGNYTVIGINYSTQSGELISFAELSDNPDVFHAETLSYLENLAASESYQELLFPSTSSAELESVLYADEKWYLSTSGLIFLSDPYQLGAYAAGLIEFPIPYSDLNTMGLKEEYQYTGNLTVKIDDGSSYTIDLNGDGQEDTIHLYTEWDATVHENGDFVPLLTVNDIDITQGCEKLTEILSPWPTVALYDINPEDDTVEIAISIAQTDGTVGPADIVSTYFFRYEKDASVTYLGMTRGSATDPSINAANLIQ